ncbi:LysR family transcriptional regulator [Vibrio vulnificus]|uniref:LysR family transcriptional regulator n=1 Tax=Vibrio vulnificus TaxID=672 RepID=UPI001023B5B7|nr:LysR family transcriptional regulator [Vibrio vulnificus]EGR0753577.1 LysR family transcriptional regulator [Vibrio vulnificus]ELM0341203.1 LysR family transcriptional regulator [Vibrio vulnificus]RZP87598.1 LysR family transcriptional regulator [Vibrio vulnificus]RZQ24209.1 LysR family transcriptional regulator [Vibrio vulnificus]RZQ30176.1 LysR family transcriptional regulator [Vibrio vulnificus]
MDIEAVRMFVLLARKLNFTQTSLLLQVSQPTLSRKIKMLEESLSVTLIHRRGGHISLTPQGDTFLEEGQKLLNQIDQTIELVQREREDEAGTIRLGCLHPMAKFITDTMIVDFHKKYPDISIHFKTMIPRTLSSFEEVDLMIAPFWPQDDSVVAKKLPRFRRYCYASKEYLEGAGMLADLEDLENHQCITQTNSVENQRTWVLSDEAGNRREVKVNGLMAADSIDITIDLVQKGFGIGLISPHKVAESGELVRLFNGKWFIENHMYVMYKQNTHMPKRFKLFIEEFSKIYSKYSHY